MQTAVKDEVIRCDRKEGCMRAIAGRQMRGLPQGARLECEDNSGAKTVEIVTVLNYKGVHRRSPAAGVGDMVVASVK